MKIQKPTVGRIVQLALVDEEHNATVHRPAVVVSTDMGGSDGINCRVFLDGQNDRGLKGVDRDDTRAHCEGWITSVHHNGDGVVPVGALATWRYPPHSKEEIEVSA